MAKRKNKVSGSKDERKLKSRESKWENSKADKAVDKGLRMAGIKEDSPTDKAIDKMVQRRMKMRGMK